MSERPDYPRIRRVVTGHENTTAKVIIDGPATNEKYPDAGMISTLMWATDAMPADIAIGTSIEDVGNRILGSAPPVNGTRFAILDFPPGNTAVTHRTETLDYVIVLEGEIEMDMDDSKRQTKGRRRTDSARDESHVDEPLAGASADCRRARRCQTARHRQSTSARHDGGRALSGGDHAMGSS